MMYKVKIADEVTMEWAIVCAPSVEELEKIVQEFGYTLLAFEEVSTDQTMRIPQEWYDEL